MAKSRDFLKVIHTRAKRRRRLQKTCNEIRTRRLAEFVRKVTAKLYLNQRTCHVCKKRLDVLGKKGFKIITQIVQLDDLNRYVNSLQQLDVKKNLELNAEVCIKCFKRSLNYGKNTADRLAQFDDAKRTSKFSDRQDSNARLPFDSSAASTSLQEEPSQQVQFDLSDSSKILSWCSLNVFPTFI